MVKFISVLWEEYGIKWGIVQVEERVWKIGGIRILSLGIDVFVEGCFGLYIEFIYIW